MLLTMLVLTCTLALTCHPLRRKLSTDGVRRPAAQFRVYGKLRCAFLMGLLTATSSLATCGTATCGNQGCFDIYQPSGDHHHIITSSSASSLKITYGQGDTLGGSHPNSPWTCTCTAESCPRLVGSFACNADFYGSTSLNIGLSNGAYTFEPFDGTALVVRTCELSSDKNSLQVKYQQDFFSPSCEPLQAQEDAEDIVEAHATEKDEM